jgi:two-component system nitrogen regulation response regulator GlnG
MQEVYKSIGRVAPQDVTVLILGESGTGKELVARSIFHYSKRSDKPFLAVNCAALSESLLESELFGHEKGAFTGADSRRIGKFEQVNGGTIFLDEVGDMSPSTQAKALRLLQQQQFERLGGTTTIQTDVRIIAATNRDLATMVQEGTFREDLFYRLNGFTIQLPALRDRKLDISMLIDYFVQVVSRNLGKPIRQVSDTARDILLNHDWPGNVRELYSAVRYAVVNSSSGIITAECLPPSCADRRLVGESQAITEVVENSPETVPELSCELGHLAELRSMVAQGWASGSNDIYREVMQRVDAAIVEESLKHSGGNQQLAAERLGISRPTLRTKLRAINVDAESEST